MRAKGTSKIDIELKSWSDDERTDAIEFASNPGNGVTTVMLYLKQRGITASLDTCNRWKKSLNAESEKISRIKQVIGDFKGLEPIEILGFVAAVMAETLVNIQEKMACSETLDNKDIQAMTSLAKEARSAACSLMASQATTAMKDLELGFAMSFADKLETIFEDDEPTLERIRTACRAIFTEIEGQYQN